MRLVNCRIQNVRTHGDLSLAFHPRLTLIGGPNESGKSTLIEALHRALFLRATVNGAAVEALRSRIHAGHPTIEVAFHLGDAPWTLRKRFSGGNGTTQLNGPGGVALNGAAAEEQLARLLGVEAMLSGQQAGRLPGRWAHLWVMQGRAGEDLLAQDASAYDSDRLINALDARAGAVMQSARDQAVIEAIDGALAEQFTATGRIQTHSPLAKAKRASEAAQTRVQDGRQQLQDFDRASDELREALEALQRITEQELPALQAEEIQITRAQADAQQLKQQIELQQTRSKPLLERQQQLQQHQDRLLELERALTDERQTLVQLQHRRAQSAARREPLRLQLAQQQQDHQTVRAALADQEQRLRLLQRLAEQARREDERTQATQALGQLRAQRQRLSELEQQLAGLPAADQRAVQALRELEGALRESRARIAAMAAGVEVVRADQPVRIDESALEPGEQRQYSEAFTLAVGEGVQVRITPGGGEALAKARRDLAEQEAAWTAALAAAGVASLEQAEQSAERRQRAQQERDQLAATASGAEADRREQQLNAALASHEQRLRELAQDLSTLSAVQESFTNRAPLPEGVQALETAQRHEERSLDEARQRLALAEQALQQTQQALDDLTQADVHDGEQQPILETRISALQTQHAQALTDHGDQAALAEALAANTEAVQAALQTLTQQQATLQALPLPPDPAQRLAEIAQRISVKREEVDRLNTACGVAQARCQAISERDPRLLLEQAEAELEQAQRTWEALDQRVQAQRYLKTLFAEAQTALAERYTGPLAAAISEYLTPLLPAQASGTGCQLRLEQGQLSGLRLQRGNNDYAVAELSGGMREQLMAALRLAMADVLKDDYQGCLPLVFDDAFANADPRRIEMIRRMLSTAVERGLQVILLTCDPTPYEGLADQRVDLPAA